mmetsp:Transcript_18085/g.45336  ORF Transcript_18085/g.45336 Transcript_18085/m.45336 type:complete len:270 (-) Transcript_18085:4622-5431(-)
MKGTVPVVLEGPSSGIGFGTEVVLPGGSVEDMSKVCECDGVASGVAKAVSGVCSALGLNPVSRAYCGEPISEVGVGGMLSVAAVVASDGLRRPRPGPRSCGEVPENPAPSRGSLVIVSLSSSGAQTVLWLSGAGAPGRLDDAEVVDEEALMAGSRGTALSLPRTSPPPRSAVVTASTSSTDKEVWRRARELEEEEEELDRLTGFSRVELPRLCEDDAPSASTFRSVEAAGPPPAEEKPSSAPATCAGKLPWSEIMSCSSGLFFIACASG